MTNKTGAVLATPSSTWLTNGEPDPHHKQYDCERAALTLGNLTDDELANGAFMNYDRRQSLSEMLNPQPGQHMPIVWMTAVKERIRWLSRALERALAPEVQARAVPEAYQQFLDETADATRPYARQALVSCIAECQALSYSEDRGITVSEAESIGGVLHELRRLQNLELEAVAILTRESATTPQTDGATVALTDSNGEQVRLMQWHGGAGLLWDVYAFGKWSKRVVSPIEWDAHTVYLDMVRAGYAEHIEVRLVSASNGTSPDESAAWFAVADGAAAALEDAAVCMLDVDAKHSAQGAATFVRRRCRELLAATHAPAMAETQTDAVLSDRLIAAIEGECDGLAITAEQASSILAYLQYGRALDSVETLLRDAMRYRKLRDADINVIHKGGVFAGLTPDNVVINGEDLDIAVDLLIDDAAASGGEQGS